MSTTDPEVHPDPVRAAIAVLDDIIAANHEARQNLLAILSLFAEVPRGAAGGGDGSAAVAPARLHDAGTAGEGGGAQAAALPLAGELRFETLVTADSMEAGGAVRLPGSSTPNVWRELHSVQACDSAGAPCRMLAFRDGSDPVHVPKYDTLPYLTPAEWAPEEPLPTGCVRVALCVLDDGHAGDCVDERGETYQGWAA